MDEETFNRSTRKFLKTLGVTTQREIEQAVREQIQAGSLQGDESLEVQATVIISGLSRTITVPGRIDLT